MASLSFIFLQCDWLFKESLKNLIGCFVLLSHSHWLRKRCDLQCRAKDSAIREFIKSILKSLVVPVI